MQITFSMGFHNFFSKRGASVFSKQFFCPIFQTDDNKYKTCVFFCVVSQSVEIMFPTVTGEGEVVSLFILLKFLGTLLGS